jgi:hypothetical protein
MLSEGRAGIDNVYSLKEGRYPGFLVLGTAYSNCNRYLDIASG